MEIPALPCSHQGTCYPEDPEAIRAFFAQALDRVPSGAPALTFDGPEFLIVPHIDFRVNLDLTASIDTTECWHEARDQSMVSFSCGSLLEAQGQSKQEMGSVKNGINLRPI